MSLKALNVSSNVDGTAQSLVADAVNQHEPLLAEGCLNISLMRSPVIQVAASKSQLRLCYFSMILGCGKNVICYVKLPEDATRVTFIGAFKLIYMIHY